MSKLKAIEELNGNYNDIQKCHYYLNLLINGNCAIINDVVSFLNSKYEELYVSDVELVIFGNPPYNANMSLISRRELIKNLSYLCRLLELKQYKILIKESLT